MTPAELSLCMAAFEEKQKADHKERLWFMWHQAALSRCKEMPKLSVFIGDKRPVRGIDEAGIVARLKAYQQRRCAADGDSPR